MERSLKEKRARWGMLAFASLEKFVLSSRTQKLASLSFMFNSQSCSLGLLLLVIPVWVLGKGHIVSHPHLPSRATWSMSIIQNLISQNKSLYVYAAINFARVSHPRYAYDYKSFVHYETHMHQQLIDRPYTWATELSFPHYNTKKKICKSHQPLGW